MTGIDADIINGVKMMNYFCKGCSEIFAIPARRGRPPLLCQKCSGDGIGTGYDAQRQAEIRAIAEARVDRLEVMLKAIGNHISQHRHKWD